MTDEGAVERHLDAVLKLSAVDAERIRKRKFMVALDAVRGAGGPVMRALLERLGCEVAGINLEPDGHFPRSPEPVPENLGGLSTLVTRAGAELGIAVDPDVDRLAIVDETGTPIGEDYTLAFAVRAVLGGPADGRTGGPKTRSPSVVCNLSTSLVVEDAARDCGADVVRTPVGEVHVARAIVRLGAVIGGEGNGGVMYPALHAGRDAPVAAALLLTLLARDGRRVSELVAAAPRYAIVKPRWRAAPRSSPCMPRCGAASPTPRWIRRMACVWPAGPLAPRAAVEHRADHPVDRRGAVRRRGPGTRGRGTARMCGIVGYTGPRQAAPLLLEDCGASSTAGTTRPGSR